MNTKPSVNVHRRILERNFSLKYRNLSNPQTKQKIKCININMQYIVHHFSSESLVQCSLTYNRDKKQCTRTTILCMRHHCMLHVRLSVLTHAVCQYLVKRAYTLHTFSACMPHLPPQQRGEPPCTSRQHTTRTAYTLLGPLTCHKQDTSAASSTNFFHEALHLLFIEQRK